MNGVSESNVTPNKKLKQARLPFKLISDGPPASRKRKLSTDETAVSKIGKLSKENDSDSSGAFVVISDDDNSNIESSQKTEKLINPFVKIVDNARKKKKHKSKTPKKKNIKSADEKKCSDSESKLKDCTEIPSEESQCTVEQYCDVVHTENVLPDTKINTSETVLDNDYCKPVNKDDIESETNAEKLRSSVKDITCNNMDCSELSENDELVSQKKDVNTSKQSVKEMDIDSPVAHEDELSNSKLITPKKPKSKSEKGEGQVTPKLTPKQLQRKLESAKKKDEREREKLERERKRQEEREEKAKARHEKEDQKRKEREEKEELKKKEKDEKERIKEMERKIREEKEERKRREKEEKEESRRKEKEAKEEEKRKRQEALELERQENELKKKKAADAFVNFFVPKQKIEKEFEIISKSSILSSFAIKSDMRLAPTVRCQLAAEMKKELDDLLEQQNFTEDKLYLRCLKDGAFKPLTNSKTWPVDKDEDNDVIIVEDDLPPLDGAGEVIMCDSTVREKLRPKLLSFHENRRPPYWGTWRKKSSTITPRRPFNQDEKLLDYEVDSEEEWEEEEGESISGSVAGSDEEPNEADEYEVDNELFVPHGYLSDEEATMEEDDVLTMSPETHKARLKFLEDEFETQLKKPTEKLKPRLYGLIWETNDGGKPEQCFEALWKYFSKLSMTMTDPTQLLQPSNEPDDTEKKIRKKKQNEKNDETEAKGKNKRKNFHTGDNKKIKSDSKKKETDDKKKQADINTFLAKLKSA